MAHNKDDDFKVITTLRFDPVLARNPENCSLLAKVEGLSPFMPLDQTKQLKVKPLNPLGLPMPLGVPQLLHRRQSEEPCPYYMPYLHLHRLLRAAEFFGWLSPWLSQGRDDAKNNVGVVDDLRDTTAFCHMLNQHCPPIEDDGQRSVKDKNGHENLQPSKVRVALSKHGEIQVDFTLVPALYSQAQLFPPSLPSPRELRASRPKPGDPEGFRWPPPCSWTIALDYQDMPSDMQDPHLHFKTDSRSRYDDARERRPRPEYSWNEQEQGPSPLHEVLLWNEHGNLTEGTFTSVYFWRHGRWVTPHVSTWYNPEGLQIQGVSHPETLGQAGTTRRYAIAKGLCVEEDVNIDSLQNGEFIWLSNGVRGFGWGCLERPDPQTLPGDGSDIGIEDKATLRPASA